MSEQSTQDKLTEGAEVLGRLLELAGLETPADMQGRSLLPILNGEAPPEHHRDYVRCEYYAALPGTRHRWAKAKAGASCLPASTRGLACVRGIS